MCLLVVATRLRDDLPLVVGANRDEFLERPAIPMDVLRSKSPRTLGGRDLVASGTWLAVNEHGVVAGLTNRPSLDGRDLTKRSRGELPLALTSFETARAAVDGFGERFRPSEFNPAWLVVADRDTAFTIDMTGEDALVTECPPGLVVIENRAPGVPSPKVSHVRSLLGLIAEAPADDMDSLIAAALSDHFIPEDPDAIVPESRAACVHSEEYGTRWSGIVTVASDTSPPTFRYADGSPCMFSYTEASWALTAPR